MTVQNNYKKIFLPTSISSHPDLSKNDKILWATIRSISDSKLGTHSTKIWDMGQYARMGLSDVWSSYSRLRRLKLVKVMLDHHQSIIIKSVIPIEFDQVDILPALHEQSQEEER